MELGFLFWLFFIGIIIASFQDLRRREVDNWLNLLLLVSGFGFIFLKAIFLMDYSVVLFAVISLIILFVFSNLFYYSRVFAGGDAKLLFSMAVLFVGSSFFETINNIGLFVIFLLVSGSVYGLLWGFGLFFKNFEKTKEEFKKRFNNPYLRYAIFAGIILFVLSFVEILFLFVSLFILFFIVLFVFAKAIESASMIKLVSTRNLTEGDWLAGDIKIGRKIFRADWEGLSNEDLRFLKKYKKKIKIKQGLPFVPAFLIAFLLYTFKEKIIEIFFNFI